MKQQYFQPEPGPAPLCRKVRRAVRFAETDPMGLVWHGRYADYFEDARVMLGDALGIGYFDFYDAGLLIPVTRFRVDYRRPLRYKDEFTVEARLHYTLAARLHMEYAIVKDGDPGFTVCTGCTVQHFTTLTGELCLARPDFFDEFCGRWERGELPETLPLASCFSHGGPVNV